jgi:hypothetical protein
VYHLFDAAFEELKIIKNSAEMRKVTAHQSTKDQKVEKEAHRTFGSWFLKAQTFLPPCFLVFRVSKVICKA